MDRQEKTVKKDETTGEVVGVSDRSAIQEVEREFGFPVVSIIKMEHLVAYLESSEGQAKSEKGALERVLRYKAEYGVA